MTIKMSTTEADENHVFLATQGSKIRIPPEADHKSSTTPQYLVAMAVSVILISAGTTVGWSSPALVEMRSPNATVPLTMEESSWVGSLLAIGAFVGALPAGSMVEQIGRKWTIMSLSVPLTVSWILMHYATTVNMVYIARFISGIALGAVCAAVPVYLIEIADDRIRGTVGSMFQLMLVTGVMYAYIIGAIFPYTEMPLFCGVLNIIFVVLFFKAPESPIYLMQKGRRDEAKEALICLRGKQYNIHKEIDAMEEDIKSKKAGKVSFFKELSKRSSVLSLLVCLILMFFQQLSGINVVIFFMESIFHDSGSTLDPDISTIIAGVAQMLATLGSTVLIDYTGRRILLQVSSMVMALCLAVLGYYFHEKTNGSDVTQFGSIPVFAVVVFIIMYGVGFGPIPWLMSGEILPPEVKGTGLGIASGFKWFLAFAVTKAFQPINDALGPATSYWLFASICVTAFFFTTFVVIETKGKSLVEIQEEMFGKKKRSMKKKSNVVVCYDLNKSDEGHVFVIPGEPERQSSKTPQYRVVMTVSLILVSVGTATGWSSPALVEMRSPNAKFPLTAEEGSWVGSILAIGAFIGALPAGSMVEHIGRKWTIMSLSVPITISWILMYCATSVNMVYIARFIAGITVGGVCATVPVYLVEIAETSIRGTVGSTFQLMLVTGGLYVCTIAAIFPYTELPLFCGIINIIFALLFFKAPESPIYLMQKGRRDEAKDALICLRGKQYNIHKELDAMEEEINSKKEEKVPFLKELSKRSSVMSLLVCLILMFLQQMSGINAVGFYMEGIFHDAGSTLDPDISTIIAGVAQMLATLGSTVLIDYTGRRILLQVSSMVMALCLAVLGYYFHEKTKSSDVTQFGSIPVFAVVVFVMMYGVGFGPIPWLMSGEILPPEVKGTGLGIASGFKWFLAFVVTKTFQPINDALGPATSYWIFASICVAAFFFSTFVVIETKGKSLIEIQEEMFGKKDKIKKMDKSIAGI